MPKHDRPFIDVPGLVQDLAKSIDAEGIRKFDELPFRRTRDFIQATGRLPIRMPQRFKVSHAGEV